MQKLLQEQLSAPFEEGSYDKIEFEGGGVGYSLKTPLAIERLNSVFGVGMWKLEHITEPMADAEDKIYEFMSEGRLVASVFGHKIKTSINYGGFQCLANASLGDGAKSSRTNLLKKCCLEWGIGVHDDENVDGEKVEPTEVEKNKVGTEKSIIPPGGEPLSKEGVNQELDDLQSELNNPSDTGSESIIEAASTGNDNMRPDGLPTVEWVESQLEPKTIFKELEGMGITREMILEDSGRKRMAIKILKEWYEDKFIAALDGQGVTIAEYFSVEDTDGNTELKSKEEMEAEEAKRLEEKALAEKQARLEDEANTRKTYPLDVEEEKTPIKPLETDRVKVEALEVYKKLMQRWLSEDDEDTLELVVAISKAGGREEVFADKKSLNSTFEILSRVGPDELISELV